MDCPNCGYHLPDDTKHCIACGAALVHGQKSRGGKRHKSTPFLQTKATPGMKVTSKTAIVAKKEAEKPHTTKQAALKAVADRDAAIKKACFKGKTTAARIAAEKTYVELRHTADETTDAQKAAACIEHAVREAAKKAAVAKAAAQKEMVARQAAAKEAAEKEITAAAKKEAEHAKAESAVEEANEKAEAAKDKTENEKSAMKCTNEPAEETTAEKADIKSTSEEIKAASAPTKLHYQIIGGSLPAVTVTLNKDERICAQPDCIVWMSDNISMQMQADSFAVYNSDTYGQEICFASHFPGTILDLLLGEGLIVQQRKFLCAQPSVKMRPHIALQTDASVCVFRHLSGTGLVFIEINGSLIEHTLGRGKTIKASTGYIAAYQDSVTHQTEFVTDQNLLLSTLTGPGRVWLQTIDR